MPRNSDIAENLYDAFNARDFDRSLSLAAPDVKWVNLTTGEEYRGHEGMRNYMTRWTSAFPDAKVTIRKITADEETVVTEFEGKGHHDGVLKLPNGEIPPTGRDVDMPFCEIVRVKNGQIVEGRIYFDSATMLRQLGIEKQG